jgi:hypothetical protein
MLELNHDNLNAFIGICTDSPTVYLSIWRYCSRGSLKDIIEMSSLTHDWSLKISLLLDIIEVNAI